jgi:hypothetical protein
MREKHSTVSIEEALELWRSGWKQTRSPNLPLEWVQDYERAVSAVEIVGLRDCHTMADLLALYYDGEDQLEPMIQGALSDAAQHGRLLNWGLVEDGAFWQRYRTLLGRAVTDAGAGQET